MQPRRQLWQRHRRHRLWLWKVAAGWKQLGQLASHAGVPDACPAAMAAAVAVAVASAKTIKSFFGCLTLIHIHVIWPTGAHSKWNLFLFFFFCFVFDVPPIQVLDCHSVNSFWGIGARGVCYGLYYCLWWWSGPAMDQNSIHLLLTAAGYLSSTLVAFMNFSSFFWATVLWSYVRYKMHKQSRNQFEVLQS